MTKPRFFEKMYVLVVISVRLTYHNQIQVKYHISYTCASHPAGAFRPSPASCLLGSQNPFANYGADIASRI